jgi:demethylmenaquinone methyltransferase/2-methoxy-6-polyprenyl-1,4-benzoquinol methylase
LDDRESHEHHEGTQRSERNRGVPFRAVHRVREVRASVISAPDKQPDRIARMFDAIAPRYDLLNRVLSAGIDRRWRKRAIASLGLSGSEVLLDVCTGTADVALEARAGGQEESAGAARVVGIDFAAAMLGHGLKKVRAAGQDRRIALIQGDATQLPVRDGSADAVTIAFGIRNVQRPELACAEMARALRPGGRLAILEFGVPRIPGIRTLYLWYFKYLLPLVGRTVSGHDAAYSYLPASVGTFPPPPEFVTILRHAGFTDVEAVPLTFGIVYLYTGRRAS